MQSQQQMRGPQGAGVAAWVPRAGPPVIVSQRYFTSVRPTATSFEKYPRGHAEDKTLGDIWAATSAGERQRALDEALANMGLSAADIKAEQGNAKKQLSSKKDLKTTALWAVERICANVNQAGVDPKKFGKVTQIKKLCESLGNFYPERRRRMRNTVHIEINQRPGPAAQQDQTKGPLFKPPYTDSQYNGVALAYLRAALAVGHYPEITTHFLIAAGKGRTDPRCFELGRLYATIANLLGHPADTRYGIVPSYGTKGGVDNVWWRKADCFGAPP